MELKDTKQFERDIESKAVVSKDKAALDALLSKRELNKRLTRMESEMSEIKAMLKHLLETR